MIFNRAKNRVLTNRHRICDTVFSQAKGLMFSTRIRDFGLFFPLARERKEAVHMFFVFYPIDILFLDPARRVVDMKSNFKPFTAYIPKKRCMFIVELPVGTIKKSNTTLGDVISLE